VSEWTTDVPIDGACFNFGKFKREEGKPFKQPYILETYANPEPPDIVKDIQLSQGELNSLGNMNTVGLMKKAMGEAQLAVELYTEYFGEAPYKRLAMTQQTAFNYGESSAGLVFLPITYFFDATILHRLGIDNG